MQVTTTLTTAQLSDLTAIITNKPPTRAASLDAAAERFVKIATQAGAFILEKPLGGRGEQHIR